MRGQGEGLRLPPTQRSPAVCKPAALHSAGVHVSDQANASVAASMRKAGLNDDGAMGGRMRSPQEGSGDDPPPVSPWLLAFFHQVAERRVSRAFRALRVANAARVQPGAPGLVVCLNHPSWWDPLVGFVLSRHLFPRRTFHAPMDAIALERYGIFRRLGMFPVAMDSPRGAAQFLRTGAAVLNAGKILAVTPQGEFTDVRTRPVQFRPGLAALLKRRAGQGLATEVLPLALEYTFWDQRQPEVLVNCGEPLRYNPGESTGHAAAQGQGTATQLELAMERTQDELAALSLQRDPALFSTLLEGGRGSAGFYGLIEQARALIGGSSQRGDHAAHASKYERPTAKDR